MGQGIKHQPVITVNNYKLQLRRAAIHVFGTTVSAELSLDIEIK